MRISTAEIKMLIKRNVLSKEECILHQILKYIILNKERCYRGKYQEPFR